MGLGSKMKELAGGGPNLVSATPPSTMNKPPTKRQIMHSRFNHGANLGAMFVAEKWIADELFTDKAKGTSELDAVKSTVKSDGMDQAKQKFQQHWDNWVKDDDWKWLQDRGVTAVRVPIGYWMVNNGKFCDGTAFEKYAQVYDTAWDKFKDLIKKADSFGIAVLADLHGLPGGANGQDHSGTTSGKAELWTSSKNRQIARDVLEFIARDLQPFDNVCAIQILNEAPFDAESAEQKQFYLKAIERMRAVNHDVPLIISDGWDLGKWINWVKDQEAAMNGQQLGIIIDTHVYKCFSDEDKQKSPQQLIQDVDGSIQETSDADIIVGEYSCVMDGQSWDKNQGGSRDDIVKEYGQRETAMFYHRARAGTYFWTYKFQHGRGGEWDFREMTDKGAIPNVKVVVDKPREYYDQQVQQRADQATQSHSSYWQGVDPNRDWEVWRFQQGFYTGFADARAFYEHDCSEIGRLVAWGKSRLAEHVQERGGSDLAWTFEHGLKQGVQAFLDARNG